MTNVFFNYKFLPLIYCLIALIACDTIVEEDIENDEIGSGNQSLDTIEVAKLLVYLKTGSQYNNFNTYPPSLCIGNSSNCYELPEGCYDPGLPGWHSVDHFCSIAPYIPNLVNPGKKEDHPFVDHADDWDNLYLKIPTGGSTLSIQEIEVRFEVQDGPYPEYYDFVDEEFSRERSVPSYSAGSIVPLYDWVRARREKTVNNLIPAVQFDDLPWMVREATYDIGQSGLLKYDPYLHYVFYDKKWQWLYNGGNGCDEFFHYHAAQYSNNIHSADFYSETLFVSTLGPRKWRRWGRLSQVVFDANRNNLNAKPVQKVNLNGYVTGEEYNPKAGDYFLVSGTCTGGGHAMMALNTIWHYGDHFRVPVIEKWFGLVNAVYKDLADWAGPWNAPSGDPPDNLVTEQILCCNFNGANYLVEENDMINGKCFDTNDDNFLDNCCCPITGCNNPFLPETNVNPQYRWNFYFGEVDNEWGGNPPDTPGPNAGFRATQNAFLSLTCL